MTKEFEKARDLRLKEICPEQTFGNVPNVGCGPDYDKAIVGRVMSSWAYEYFEEEKRRLKDAQDVLIAIHNIQKKNNENQIAIIDRLLEEIKRSTDKDFYEHCKNKVEKMRSGETPETKQT